MFDGLATGLPHFQRLPQGADGACILFLLWKRFSADALTAPLKQGKAVSTVSRWSTKAEVFGGPQGAILSRDAGCRAKLLRISIRFSLFWQNLGRLYQACPERGMCFWPRGRPIVTTAFGRMRGIGAHAYVLSVRSMVVAQPGRRHGMCDVSASAVSVIPPILPMISGGSGSACVAHRSGPML